MSLRPRAVGSMPDRWNVKSRPYRPRCRRAAIGPSAHVRPRSHAWRNDRFELPDVLDLRDDIGQTFGHVYGPGGAAVAGGASCFASAERPAFSSALWAS